MTELSVDFTHAHTVSTDWRLGMATSLMTVAKTVEFLRLLTLVAS